MPLRRTDGRSIAPGTGGIKMAKHKKTSTNRCGSCKYSCVLSGDIICDYLLITGKRRECKAEECDKYEKGKRIKIPFNL